MNPQKIVISTVLIIAVIGGIIYLNSQKAPRGSNDGGITVIPRFSNEDKIEIKPSTDKKNTSLQKSKKYPLAKEITTPDGFVNTDGKPITVGQFIGKKVVLIDFWTYSCINCQRTTPYLNAWYEKYSASGGSASGGKDKGLVIIGIHTPEFEFEKVYQNVLDATKRLGIKYPVVLDNDYSTWNAYQNRFWPRKYLIDMDGYIVYDHIGEGGYEETELAIQKALSELNGKNINTTVSQPKDTISVDPSKVGSPETYFGSMRNQYLANGAQGLSGEQTLSLPTNLDPNLLYLAGTWNFSSEFAATKSAGKIVFKYNAKNVYIVASSDLGLTVTVRKDGKKEKDLFIKDNQLYTLIEGIDYGEHTLEVIIPSAGLNAFTFTFG